MVLRLGAYKAYKVFMTLKNFVEFDVFICQPFRIHIQCVIFKYVSSYIYK